MKDGSAVDMTLAGRLSTTASGQARTPLAEAHRRVVEIHYALAAADQLDEDLHLRTLDRLNELLEFLDDVERAGSQTIGDQGSPEARAHRG